MGSYKYLDPIEKGYTKFKLSKNQHNEIFKHRQIRWNDKYDYYYNDSKIIIHRFTNRKAVLFCTLFFPIAIILEGVINFKEAWNDLKELYNQKKSGLFVIEHVSKSEKKFNQIMSIIKFNK